MKMANNGLHPTWPLRDLQALRDSGQLSLSQTGIRVAESPGFATLWCDFIDSLEPARVRELWERALGNLLSLLVTVSNSRNTVGADLSKYSRSVTKAFICLYKFNILADCYDVYPIVQSIASKYTSPEVDTRLLIILRRLAASHGLYLREDEMRDLLSIPLPNRYVSIAMYREVAKALWHKSQVRQLLISLGEAYGCGDRARYDGLLAQIKSGRSEVQKLILSSLAPTVPRPKLQIAYKAFKERLPHHEKKLFEVAAELVEHFVMVNDFNRLVGKEFVDIAEVLVEARSPSQARRLTAEWPWDVLLDVYRLSSSKEETSDPVN